VIVRCLKKILSNPISGERFIFLAGRQIHEAIRVAQKGLHNINISKLGGGVVKIDLSKAYDCVNWLYICMLMTHLGFSLVFIRWTMSCLTSVSFAILINGATTHFFHSQRGLRQRCPLSLLLFLLVAKGLSRYLKVAIADGNFGGIKISRELTISHLLFVDDILIFCDGSRRDTDCLVADMDLFKKSTGMMINVAKSNMVITLVSEADLHYMVSKFSFMAQNFDEGIKYLGFHLKPNAYRKDDWKWLIGKLEKKDSTVESPMAIQGWTTGAHKIGA